LICCFRIADGLNTTTRRGEIVASVPVFGLRPMRSFFLRTMNDPNDDSLALHQAGGDLVQDEVDHG
jgi:hypothetical protein